MIYTDKRSPLSRVDRAEPVEERPMRRRKKGHGSARACQEEEHASGSDDDRTAPSCVAEGENMRLEEAKLLIKKLDELGHGEAISSKEFLHYYDQLPSPPSWIDLQDPLTDEELDQQDLRHALYRFRFYKQLPTKEHPPLDDDDDGFRLGREEEWDEYFTRLKEEEDCLRAISEEDCSPEFLGEQEYLKRFEKDGTFDWFFHPRYLDCAGLTDYQRLVLRNYGGTEYARWSEYHGYLHTYKIEQEYVEYCEELSKQLKWMEDYLHFGQPSFKWGYISTRGAYQAIKIAATGFSEITVSLAYNGYYECMESMSYDRTWFKEFDGVYFEIWRRVTQQMKSFRDALEEVHNLDRFPLRQNGMKRALEFDNSMKQLKEQFHTCTAGITAEVKDEEALELIAEAVKKLVNKPKSYEQYIRKKIDIARAIGVISEDR